MATSPLWVEIVDLVAATSASKVLHLICPSFFPMWDAGIRESVSKELKKRNKSKFGLDSSAAGYYRFMNETKRFMKKYEHTLSQIQQKYLKSFVKLCDEHMIESA